jgi:hypothetical protein
MIVISELQGPLTEWRIKLFHRNDLQIYRFIDSGSDSDSDSDSGDRGGAAVIVIGGEKVDDSKNQVRSVFSELR